jgi:hypothetical protein
MPEPNSSHGYGAILSPPDLRDFPIALLYDERGIVQPTTFPTSYVVPGALPPVLNQGLTPQCVAFGSAALKDYQDYIDQGGVWYNFDKGTFFVNIGGGPGGAVVRTAYNQMISAGYPLVGNSAAAAQHKIAAYWSVPVTQSDIQAAVMTFGPIGLAMTWYYSWESPAASGLLPPPGGGVAGGHFVIVIGFAVINGIPCARIRNSWGAAWGASGDCYMPWSYLGAVGEAWKATDVIENPPSPPFTPRSAMNYTGIKAIRAADSRAGYSPKVAPLAPGLNAIKLGGQFGIPAGAIDVAGKIEIIIPAGAGWVSVGPDTLKPVSSTVSFSVDGKAHPMFFIAPLAADGTLYIWNGAPVALDWDLDINGFFS